MKSEFLIPCSDDFLCAGMQSCFCRGVALLKLLTCLDILLITLDNSCYLLKLLIFLKITRVSRGGSWNSWYRNCLLLKLLKHATIVHADNKKIKRLVRCNQLGVVVSQHIAAADSNVKHNNKHKKNSHVWVSHVYAFGMYKTYCFPRWKSFPNKSRFWTDKHGSVVDPLPTLPWEVSRWIKR